MKPRDIKIVTVLNGWLVHVGCQTIVFTSIFDMMTAINEYLRDPKKTEEKYLKHSINAKFYNQEELRVVDCADEAVLVEAQ